MLIYLINILFRLYYYLIFARIIMSWVQPPMHNEYFRKFADFVYRLTEPVLGSIRELLPSFGGIDFSPIIAILALQIINSGINQLLFYLF